MTDTTTVGAVTISTPSTPTSGLKSTEFLAMIATVIGIPLSGVPPQYVPYLVGTVIAYMVCRTALKMAHAKGLAQGIPDLPTPTEVVSGIKADLSVTTGAQTKS